MCLLFFSEEMKLSSKPISSPGRTEKYPPPIMRFLKSNGGSRSRGRSRSSPMFVRKKNNAIETTQEPSSPKVTCIGQVRVRRSKQKKQSGNKQRINRVPARRRRCRWVCNALFCTRLSGKLKRKSFRPCFRKWVLFFKVGFRRKAEVGGNSSQFESRFEEKGEEIERSYRERYVQEEEEVVKTNLMCSSTPPKNALLLTRCRSAPYRSSSLASRFWGSPVMTTDEKTEEQQKETGFEKNRVPLPNIEKPTSETESNCRDSSAESRTDRESTEEEDEEEEKEESVVEVNGGLEKTGEVGFIPVRPPLILTRCKSEPARRRE